MRPDVQDLKLERRLALVEGLLDLDSRADVWVVEFVEALAPWQVTAMPLARFGSIHDGGYVLPADVAHTCTGVISIGVGDNNEADVVLARLGMPVHEWDHTVPSPPQDHPLISFHRRGIGPSTDELLPLQSIINASFGEDASDLVLLMDAEGAEWDGLGASDDATLKRFAVIGAEIHGLGNMLMSPAPYLDVLSRLQNLFVPVAVHANNYTATWDVAGVRLADALEVTWINRDAIDAGSLRAGNCPAHLLSPCCPDLPDIFLPWANANPQD